MLNKTRFWVMVLLLWGIWFVRAYNIMAMPIFVDESLHIIRAQVVYDFTDAKASILPAKLLLYYYLGLFDPQDVGGAWLSRQAVALLAPLSAALTALLAQKLFKSWRVGMLALVIYAVLPFFVFFDRMAFADPFAMLFGIALAILSLNLARRPSRRNALYVGAMLGTAMLAKLTAAPWLLLPPLAAWFFGGWNRQQYLRYGSIVAAVVALMFVPSAAYMVYQEINPPENKVESVEQDLFTPAERDRIEQITYNLETYIESTYTMFTTPLLGLLVVLGIWQFTRTPRAVLYLLAFGLLVWVPITITAARPSTRYLVAGVPGFLLILSAGFNALILLANRARGTTKQIVRFAVGMAALVVLLGLLEGAEFVQHAWNEPQNLALAERDIWEYYQQSAAGYPLAQAADDITQLEPMPGHASGNSIPMAGFVGACHAMRLYFPASADVGLHCPYYEWSPDEDDATLAAWEDRVRNDGTWYFLTDTEEQPMNVYTLNLDVEVIATYQRPHDGIPVQLLKVSAPR